ncbi:hypothetical protein HT667_02285 [Ursidibacter maritimus]|uniref:hypothetical protein n=1 Tax=Ursidibacter maritimus TaxID=1331689 RepID=UPI001C43F3AD|nr:hypothetical protein [Ursidibacter maritimus]MBV6540304.1 hypothetical protein [Ursidibacter maritimus]
MSHDHNSTKFETATYALLPVLLMVFIEMYLNHFFTPPNALFVSPYLLAFFVCVIISLVVLWKGQICPGQKGRLTFVLPFLFVFSLGNFLYTFFFTPQHSPTLIPIAASLFLPFIYWKLPDDEKLYNTILFCGFAIASIGIVQYLAIYWYEIPSLFNGIRANNFAQLLLGILLAGWYLVLAKSRLEGLLKLLVLVALIVLVLNYIWTAFVLYQLLAAIPEMVIYPYFIFFGVQFVIFAMLAWLLLAKNIKNPTAWTVATFLAILYPFTNIIYQ